MKHSFYQCEVFRFGHMFTFSLLRRYIGININISIDYSRDDDQP